MFEAAILGLLQGLTEFMPVSSSAHLIIMPWFFRWAGVVNTISFGVARHFGTLIALIVYFRQDLLEALFTAPGHDSLVWKILVGTIPVAAAGLFLHDWFERIRSPLFIVFTLCIVSVLMLVSESGYHRSRQSGIEKLSLKDALFIGIAQAFALMPGVSRSGITIIAGLSRGLRRDSSARFSFLLSTPAVAGASMLEGVNLMRSGGIEADIFITGIIVSAITGYCAIKFLLSFFRRHSLRPFAYYRFFLAFVIIVTVWTRA
jgi:undecaprenyl-diphosphatase